MKNFNRKLAMLMAVLLLCSAMSAFAEVEVELDAPQAIDGLDLSAIGPQFEYAPIFPDRVNTEFVRVIDRQTIRLRVWERGSGETMACGTGACAAVAAAVKMGLLPAGKPIAVKLPGGTLSVLFTEDGMILTGDTLLTFEGSFVY